MYNKKNTGVDIMAKTTKLTVLFEKLRGQTFNLEQDIVTIGRKEGMNIVLKDGSVSGHHADIIRTEQDGEVIFTLRDNESTNGTRVNNQPVTEQVLKNSDLITFGNVEVLFDGERRDSDATSDFSHLTHTIDISSLEENTSAPQTLTNFNPMAVKQEKQSALFQKGMLITIIVIAIGVIALVASVFYQIFSKQQ